MGLMNLKPQLSLADCGAMLSQHNSPDGDRQQDHGRVQNCGISTGNRHGDGFKKEEHGPKQDNFATDIVFNQNMTTGDDSEEELIDDLLKDV